MDLGKAFEKEIRDVDAVIAEILPKEPKEAYGMLYEYIMRGGKRIRPAILLTVAQAIEEDQKKREETYKRALLPSALIECFHAFSLIHDDIEDGSVLRRGKPTLHVTNGMPVALNSGDSLYTFIWNKMLDMNFDTEKKIKMAKAMGETYKEVVEGQAYDLFWEHNNIFDQTEQDYFTMVSKKTGALIGISAALPSIMLDKPSLFSPLYAFGKSIGIAFQIQDDVLNLVGDEEKYKKKIGDDITEGKRTLMVIHALANLQKDDASRLKAILTMHTTEEKLIAEAIALMGKTDSIAHARKVASKLVEKEKNEISSLLPRNEFSSKMIELSNFIVNRDM
jgi:geranylgeranyl diphosphate synthase type I